jgi:hypothetical protein
MSEEFQTAFNVTTNVSYVQSTKLAGEASCRDLKRLGELSIGEETREAWCPAGPIQE